MKNAIYNFEKLSFTYFCTTICLRSFSLTYKKLKQNNYLKNYSMLPSCKISWLVYQNLFQKEFQNHFYTTIWLEMGRHQVSISQIKSDKSLSWIITLSFHCSIFLGNIDSKTPVFVSIFPSLFPKSFIPKITYTIRKRTTIAYLETKFQFLRASLTNVI